MDTKTCGMCFIEKHINNFDKKKPECKDCKRARGLKGYDESKDKFSGQQNI